MNTSSTEPLQKSRLITAGLEVLANLSVTLLEHIEGFLAGLWACGHLNMTGYCVSVRPYFHSPAACENTAQECNIQSYYLLRHQIIDLLYTTLI